MSIISLPFFIFVSILVFLYYTLFRKHAWILLLLASYGFYIAINPINLIYLMLTTLSVYLGAIKTESLNHQLADLKKLSREQRRPIKAKLENSKKTILVLVLVFNFGMLSIFKYSGYVYSLLGSLSERLPLLSPLYNEGLNAELLNLIQPLGISFFIFQSTGYLIDVYRKKYPAERNLFKFALFVSYFPQMVQGPIGRWDGLSSQLFKEPELDFDNLRQGILIITFGLLKKIIVANSLAPIVNSIFTNYINYPGGIVFLGVMIYGVQIYADFSGGIDIVRGVSILFDIELAENFRRPFFATSLADFWRRWHISLGTWLKDYVFYSLNFSAPLTKLNRWGRKRLGAKYGKFFSIAISTFIIYFIVGVWHGPGFKYMAFGIWNGTVIILSLIFEEFNEGIKRRFNLHFARWFYLFTILRTNLLVVIGRYFTRAPDYAIAKDMLKHTFQNFNFHGANWSLIQSFGLEKFDYLKIFIGLLIMIIYGVLAENNFDFDEYLERRSSAFNVAFILIIVVFFVLTVVYQDGYVSSEFIYRQY